MRIGLVLPSASGYSETFFSNKIKGLQNNGHEVILFVNSHNKSISESSIKIKEAPKLSGSFINVAFISLFAFMNSVLFHFKSAKRLYNLDKSDGIGFSQRIKNIIANNYIFSESLDWLHFGFGTLALQRENVAASINAKMAVSFRGFDIAIYPVKNPNCYHMLWKKVDKIHVISNDIKDLVYKHGFKDEAPIVKITPAINLAFFNGTRTPNINNTFRFVTIARLHWKKGLDYTLEALSILKEANAPFHYTIIGKGEAYERLKFTVHQLQLQDHVTFTGRLTHELVKNELKKSDIYIQYSNQEGFCNAVLEAQAMGLLCVVSDAEGLSENVLDKKTGWVVPKRQPKLLASRLIDVLNLPHDKTAIISENAQKHVCQHFNLEQQHEAFNLFYSSISVI